MSANVIEIMKTALWLIFTVSLSLTPATGNAGNMPDQDPGGAPPKPIKTITLSQPALAGKRSFPGYLRALHDATLSFRVSGPLVDLPAVKGTLVKKGDLLARIDPRDYRNSLASLDAEVERAREQLLSMEQARPEDIASAEAAVAAARARAENDAAELERYRVLFEQKVVPKSALDKLQAQADVSAGGLEQATQALRIARGGARREDVNAARASLESLEARRQAAADTLADVELRAPFDGIVSERHVENHQMTAASAPIVSLQDLETFEVVINVPEQLLIRLPKNSILDNISAIARFDAIPGKTFPLAFKEYSTSVDVRAQTFAATFLFSPGDDRHTFLPGMTVTVDVMLDRRGAEANNAFVFPPAAVLFGNDGAGSVWHLAETGVAGVYRTEKTPVAVGEFTGDGLLIESGAVAGEKYAVSGVAHLTEGMTVSELAWDGK